MPGFDGTGPAGGGSMTGWGRGFCKGSSGFVRPRFGRGIRSEYGGGRGNRYMYWKTGLPRWARRWTGRGAPYSETRLSQEDEISMLKEEADMIRKDLHAIERRMLDLEAEKKSDQ